MSFESIPGERSLKFPRFEVGDCVQKRSTGRQDGLFGLTKARLFEVVQVVEKDGKPVVYVRPKGSREEPKEVSPLGIEKVTLQ
jgi:hypothetical protein